MNKIVKHEDRAIFYVCLTVAIVLLLVSDELPTPKEYLTLAHNDWRRYIPIPRVLKKITPSVECDGFVMRDFV